MGLFVSRLAPVRGEGVLGLSGCVTVVAVVRVRPYQHPQTVCMTGSVILQTPFGVDEGWPWTGQRTCCSEHWFRVRQHNSGGVSSPLLTSDARWGVRPVASDL
jgi:hypothetical protein